MNDPAAASGGTVRVTKTTPSSPGATVISGGTPRTVHPRGESTASAKVSEAAPSCDTAKTCVTTSPGAASFADERTSMRTAPAAAQAQAKTTATSVATTIRGLSRNPIP